MILNRLGLQNLIEPFTKTLEFQVQEPFLLYRNAKNIYGIWFYEKDECTRLGTLMNRTVQSIQTFPPSETVVPPVVQTRQHVQHSPVLTTTTTLAMTGTTVDIMKILTKAQHEYDQSKSTVVKRSEPKSMTDNLGSGIQNRDQPLVRPTPVKYDSHPVTATDTNPGITSTPPQGNPMSIEALFQKASLNQRGGAELPDVTKPSALQRSVSCDREDKTDLHPLLMQLIKKTPTLEQIERQQQSSHDARERPPSQGYEEFSVPVSPRSDVTSTELLRPTDVVPPPLPSFTQPLPSVESEKDLSDPISCPDVLLSPMAFTKSTNPTLPSSSASLNLNSVSLSESCESEESSLPVAALTKQQLQQAFVYLLKNDEGFMSNIHEAYLKSLQELTKQK
ncbi:mRNA-decapping enzyme 1B isoform X2 [Patella vulgata]|nr:mRNA-decapping enzyme 1B isoform X2 [Patella vulgata]XP_055958152.1 mRNA-decapping enzyme 1B isoform X2 [Patella vulgata]